jgi:ketosteroid isomerase-like protein
VGSENVETIRTILEMVNRREIDEMLERYAAEDIEFDYSRSLMPGITGIYRGAEEWRPVVKGILEAWREFEFVVDEVIEIDDSTVVVAAHTRNVGKGSGVEVSAHGAHLWEFADDGKLVAWRLFQSQDDALEAARSGSASSSG